MKTSVLQTVGAIVIRNRLGRSLSCEYFPKSVDSKFSYTLIALQFQIKTRSNFHTQIFVEKLKLKNKSDAKYGTKKAKKSFLK